MLSSRVFDSIYSYRKLIGGGTETACRPIHTVHSPKGVRDTYPIRHFTCPDRYFSFLSGILPFPHGSEAVFGDVALLLPTTAMEQQGLPVHWKVTCLK